MRSCEYSIQMIKERHIWTLTGSFSLPVSTPHTHTKKTHTEGFFTHTCCGDCQLCGNAFHSISCTAHSAWQTTTCATWADPLCALLITLVPVPGVRTVPYCSHCCCLFTRLLGAVWGLQLRFRWEMAAGEGGGHHMQSSYRSLRKQAPHLLVPVRNRASCPPPTAFYDMNSQIKCCLWILCKRLYPGVLSLKLLYS